MVIAISCSNNSGPNNPCSADPATPASTAPTGSNYMQITVNGSLCTLGSSVNYPNEPCASVTICNPSAPSSCQTISNILVDTGSFGLRLFSSVVTLPLAAEMNSGATVADCVVFGDGSSEWGSVVLANVVLGGQTATNVPIQLIDPNFGTPPGACSSSQGIPDTSPQEAGFNGILGVGNLAQDCGPDCDAAHGDGQYFNCTGSTCIGTNTMVTQQVTNPVSMLPSLYNNGIVMQFPQISDSCGVASATGYLILGVGTMPNNTPPAGVTTFPGDITTGWIQAVFPAYANSPIQSFIDSGSSSFFFPPNSLAGDCSSDGGAYDGLFCPGSLISVPGTLYGATGSTPNLAVSVQMNNGYDLLNSGNSVFMDLGAISGTSPAFFDLGLPFFFGRTIYFGIEGATTPVLGAGPYFAY
jgi:hypothetical protein